MPISKAKTFAAYELNYRASIETPDSFWAQEAERLHWFRPFSAVKTLNSAGQNHSVRWFEDGELNVSFNCLDRHLSTHAEKPALIWEGDAPDQSRIITYRALHEDVCRLANVLKNLGVQKGDRVIIYLPMIPEAAVAMLACSRIGAIHSVVFGGFSPDSLANRLDDCTPVLIITANAGVRGGKSIPLKKNVDEALLKAAQKTVRNVIVVQHQHAETTPWDASRDLWYHAEIEKASTMCDPVSLSAEDPLFILYTSGSTGKPKGVLHTTGGYLLYAAMTHEHVFDLEKDDIFWCTADVGWITGHSYVVYGPLANGATTLMFEGVPTWPDAGRFWQIIDKYKVTLFYTAPTALRSLLRLGDDWIHPHDLSSLRVLGTVGEPIDPHTWQWYSRVIGGDRCPVVDTWWQTETGGILIAPLAGVTPTKPGSATLPFYGVQPAIVDAAGVEQKGEASGPLILTDSWPGQMRTVYQDHQRYIDTYFSTYPGQYFTGDGAHRDKDGYFWITGRIDDVLNVSGHRIGTAELEGELDAHPAVAESAVIGYPHETKGQGIYAYIALKNDFQRSASLKKELIDWIRHRIGAIATIDKIQWVDQLPKTRSGKVMRRILRKIATDEFDQLGDISTLTDPGVVDVLIHDHQNQDL